MIVLQELGTAFQELRRKKTRLIQKKSKSASHHPYKNLDAILNLLRQVFFGDGKGLTDQQLCNKEFLVMPFVICKTDLGNHYLLFLACTVFSPCVVQSLASDIQLASMTADQLAVQFLSELSLQQVSWQEMMHVFSTDME